MRRVSGGFAEKVNPPGASLAGWCRLYVGFGGLSGSAPFPED
jgi:hypothetical protein